MKSFATLKMKIGVLHKKSQKIMSGNLHQIKKLLVLNTAIKYKNGVMI